MSQILEQAEKLLQALPKEQLGFFPTPFYRLDRLSEELGVNLFIKRDDFTGMNLFGGPQTGIPFRRSKGKRL